MVTVTALLYAILEESELQMRRSGSDNFGIIFHNTPLKHIL